MSIDCEFEESVFVMLAQPVSVLLGAGIPEPQADGESYTPWILAFARMTQPLPPFTISVTDD